MINTKKEEARMNEAMLNGQPFSDYFAPNRVAERLRKDNGALEKEGEQ